MLLMRRPIRVPSAAGAALALACGGGEEAARSPAAEAPETVHVVRDLPIPESAALGPDGRYYVSVMGEFGTAGDGRIVAVHPETWEVSTVAEGLDDPKGLAFLGDMLYVTDRTVVRSVGPGGEVRVFVPAQAFPRTPKFLNDLAVDPAGNLYVSDSGEFEAADGVVYRIGRGGQPEALLTADGAPLSSPNGLVVDAAGNLWIVDLHTGDLLRRSPEGVVETVAGGFGGGDGLVFGPAGHLYVSDFRGGRVLRVTWSESGAQSEVVAQLPGAADIGIDPARNRLLVPQLQENTLTVLALP
jgi:sugar lactone lactonase YvrE